MFVKNVTYSDKNDIYIIDQEMSDEENDSKNDSALGLCLSPDSF